MCGVAGYISKNCDWTTLKKMGDVISHRGPDETGYYQRDQVGLVSKRLSIIDLTNGKQPAYNENEDIVVVYNGEIFNYLQLRKDLENHGHRISNNSDTAVLPHMYEQYGTEMFEKLQGQYAIVIYDITCGKLILARDRMGIIPLHYCCRDGEFFFGSEIKAILASGRVSSELSPEAIFDVFTFWSPQNDRTIFTGIFSVLPGEYLVYHHSLIKKERYFKFKFSETNTQNDFPETAEDVEDLLLKAVQKRLIGDVKISTYLSGGLDSSLITSIVASKFDSSVEAFSICFEDARYDESLYQKMVCDHLGIKHHTILFRNYDIPELIRKIIWHTETPILRAGPLPLIELSNFVNQNNVKVVLSGEGADELFGGYDIFREVKIRNYLKKYPDSSLRSQLFRKINVFIDSRIQKAAAGGLNYFYMHGFDDDMFDSHYTRWRQFSFFERFFSDCLRNAMERRQHQDFYGYLDLETTDEMKYWTDIQKSQYLEIETFLSRYLLSSQGDRVSMANSVEVRFPFLDDDLVKYCIPINDKFKIRALNEKYILKKIAGKYLPSELIKRKKFPYRASLNVEEIMSNPYTKELLSKDNIQKSNLFNPEKTDGFIKCILARGITSERETMLLMGIMTLQVLCDTFNGWIGYS